MAAKTAARQPGIRKKNTPLGDQGGVSHRQVVFSTFVPVDQGMKEGDFWGRLGKRRFQCAIPKGTVSGVTTTYIGSYFEWTGDTASMKKYYYDGTTRVAMRTGNSTGQTTGLNWLLNDHDPGIVRLDSGSTSITADSGGNRTGGLRYKGWGENRFTSGITPTSRLVGFRGSEPDLQPRDICPKTRPTTNFP
jgi:hypothetical protein